MRSRKVFNVIIISLIFLLFSCDSGVTPEEQARKLFSSLRDNNIEACMEVTYAYKEFLEKVKDEPKFKIRELAVKFVDETRVNIFNKYKNDSIAFLFLNPCKWEILETKQITTDTGFLMPFSSIYRVYASVEYNSPEYSPISVQLSNEANIKEYQVKKIIFHCDFEQNETLYLGWGVDKLVAW